MAARTKQDLVNLAREVAKPYVHVGTGEYAANIPLEASQATTPERAQMMLTLIMIELLADIRQGEQNP